MRFHVPLLVRLGVLVYPAGSTKVACPCLLLVLGGLDQLLLVIWMVAHECYCGARGMAYLSPTASHPVLFVSFDPRDRVYYMATTPILLTRYPRSTKKGTRSACRLARPRNSFS